MIIRREEEKDYKTIETLVRDSFYNVYKPGCEEHYLIHTLRNNKDFVKELDYVLIEDNKIIGQNVFVKAYINCDNGDKLEILTMGPLSIHPDYQRKGYGKKLLDFTLEKAKELGYKAVCIEGNIDFYKHCGFKFARDYNLRYHGLPEGIDTSFFLCNELIKGSLENVKGEYVSPNAYHIDTKKAEEFDKTFPYKEKKVLPGQLK